MTSPRKSSRTFFSSYVCISTTWIGFWDKLGRSSDHIYILPERWSTLHICSKRVQQFLSQKSLPYKPEAHLNFNAGFCAAYYNERPTKNWLRKNRCRLRKVSIRFDPKVFGWCDRPCANFLFYWATGYWLVQTIFSYKLNGIVPEFDRFKIW